MQPLMQPLPQLSAHTHPAAASTKTESAVLLASPKQLPAFSCLPLTPSNRRLALAATAAGSWAASHRRKRRLAPCRSQGDEASEARHRDHVNHVLGRRNVALQAPVLSMLANPAAVSASSSNAKPMPPMGLGTCCLVGEASTQQVTDGLLAGYRLLDTASHYDNEEAVAKAVKAAGLTRSDVFLVTKVWFDDMGDRAGEAITESLERLGTDYVDMLLMHFPGANDALQSPARNKQKREVTWKAMEAAVRNGSAREIGVANFTRRHLKELLSYASITPRVNQLELHPYCQQQELVDYCIEQGVTPMAFSPLAHGELRLLDDPVLKEISAAHKCTPAQVALRWHIQRGITPIVFSTSAARLKEDFAAADGSFSLTAAEMSKISFLDRLDGRVGYNPNKIA